MISNDVYPQRSGACQRPSMGEKRHINENISIFPRRQTLILFISRYRSRIFIKRYVHRSVYPSNHRTVGQNCMKSTRTMLGHSLVCSLIHSLVHSHRSLIRYAPHCSLCSRAPLRSFVRSLAHSLAPKLVGQCKF